MAQRDIFKQCSFLISSCDESVGFCLKFKLWSEPCPPSCDQFQLGYVGSLKEVQTKKYDTDCLDFTRIGQEDGQSAYYCDLYKQTEPLCDACQFHRYETDPFSQK